MEINGKPLNLAYTVYAKLKMQEMIITHGAKDINELFKRHYDEALINCAVVMAKAYAQAHKADGAEAVTEEDFLNTPAKDLDFVRLDDLVGQALKVGEARTVEAEPPKSKKGKKTEAQ